MYLKGSRASCSATCHIAVDPHGGVRASCRVASSQNLRYAPCGSTRSATLQRMLSWSAFLAQVFSEPFSKSRMQTSFKHCNRAAILDRFLMRMKERGRHVVWGSHRSARVSGRFLMHLRALGSQIKIRPKLERLLLYTMCLPCACGSSCVLRRCD